MSHIPSLNWKVLVVVGDKIPSSEMFLILIIWGFYIRGGKILYQRIDLNLGCFLYKISPSLTGSVLSPLPFSLDPLLSSSLMDVGGGLAH